MTSPLTILYVIGAGRSGSTVLDIVLGNCENIVGVGELSSLYILGIKKHELCSCGLTASECSFFNRVVKSYLREVPEDDFEYYDYLRNRMERVRNIPFHLLGITPQRVIQDYAVRTELLYRIIQTISGKDIVLDSTKGPGKLIALSFCRNIIIFPIHLVRNCVGFVDSKKKSQQRIGITSDYIYSRKQATITSVLYWYLINIISIFACVLYWLKTGRRFIIIQYESFISNSNDTLTQLEMFLSVKLTRTMFLIREKVPFKVGHLIGGNRLKYSASIVVNKTIPDPKNVSRFELLIINILSLPIKLFYTFIIFKKL